MQGQQEDLVAIELAAESLRRTGRLRMRATGSSMLPAIFPGDVLCVSRCDVSAIAPGSVILWRRDDRLYAHRVVQASGNKFVTRGDSHGDDDPAVDSADVLGQVVEVERGGRTIAMGPASLAQRIAARVLGFSYAARLFMRLRLAGSVR